MLATLTEIVHLQQKAAKEADTLVTGAEGSSEVGASSSPTVQVHGGSSTSPVSTVSIMTSATSC